jgi:hypothetical protein
MRAVKPGDVVFHCGRGALAWGIKQVTGSPWSHVSLVTEVSEQDFMVLDVVEERVVRSINHHSSDYVWHVRAPRYPAASEWSNVPSTVGRQHVVRHALDMHRALPRPYPWRELVAYLPGFRKTRLGRRILRTTNRMVCSAMVAAAWSSMGFEWYNGDGKISPDWVDPGTMWRQANRDAWPVVWTKGEHDARDV